MAVGDGDEVSSFLPPPKPSSAPYIHWIDEISHLQARTRSRWRHLALIHSTIVLKKIRGHVVYSRAV